MVFANVCPGGNVCVVIMLIYMTTCKILQSLQQKAQEPGKMEVHVCLSVLELEESAVLQINNIY